MVATLTESGAFEPVTDIPAYVASLGQHARAASRTMSGATPAARSRALLAIADALDGARARLREANTRDLEAASGNGLEAPLLARLKLDDAAIDRMIEGVRQVDSLPDPIGAITGLSYRPSGIQVGRMRVPLGVIGIIYESRPNVTVDAAALCLKSGNACILRGGSEAFHSNRAIAACIESGLAASGLPVAAVQLIATTDRAAVGALLTQNETVDVIIPRGGKGLIERIIRESTIPIIKHLDGVCHVYIDSGADHDTAVAIAVNSKTEKFAVCNAVETLLVAESAAPELLPELARRFAEADVELRGCPRTRQLLPDVPGGPVVRDATEDDWFAEYLGPVLAVRVVADLEAAISHINHYGSHHTDVIVSADYGRIRRFLTEVDSASVMANASTQFADGFEFGLGAEIGISTDKLHARGPVGLEGLTTEKFIVLGNGEIRRR